MKNLLLIACLVWLLGIGTGVAVAQGNYYHRGRAERSERRRGEYREAQQRAYRSNDALSHEWQQRRMQRNERLSDRQMRRYRHDDERRWRDDDDGGDRGEHRRGNGYYRRGAGSQSHPVFGRRDRY